MSETTPISDLVSRVQRLSERQDGQSAEIRLLRESVNELLEKQDLADKLLREQHGAAVIESACLGAKDFVGPVEVGADVFWVQRSVKRVGRVIGLFREGETVVEASGFSYYYPLTVSHQGNTVPKGLAVVQIRERGGRRHLEVSVSLESLANKELFGKAFSKAVEGCPL